MNIQRILFCYSLLIGVLLFSDIVDARPKIGLALGGGGAKGAAHVGVLRVLEQHKIPVDYIAGTSIGSVVGGLYAAGLSVDEIQKIMLETDWEKGYSDRIPREDLPWRVKQQYDQFNIPLEMGLENSQLKMPGGLIYGQVATKLLREGLGILPNFESFDELPIPFRAVATDLANYKAVIMDKGSLMAAIRASSSVPGALAPEFVDGLLLVDGGITKNLPIDVVRSMGADIVIAVDIGNGLQSMEELTSTFSVIAQLSDFLTNSNVVVQKQMLSTSDFLITPDITGLSTTDWSFAHEAYVRGETAANEQSARLSFLSLESDAYQAYLDNIKIRRDSLDLQIEKPISRIQLNKKSFVSDALILDRLGLMPGEPIDSKIVNDAVDRLFSIDKFQRVDAFTTQEKGEKVLQVVVEDKSWGPNFLQFGLVWEDDLDNNSDLNFDIAYTMTDLTKNGGEWRSELQMGTQRSFKTEFYLPLDSKRDFYSSSRYQFHSFEWDLYVEDSPLIPIDQQFHSLSQGIGYNYTQPGFVEVGLTTDLGEFNDPVFLNGTINYFSYGSYLKFGFDDLDSISFPTEGVYFSLSSFLRHEKVDDHPVITKNDEGDLIMSLVVDVNWKGAVKFGNHAFVAKASYSEAFTKNDNESVYISYLGGFLNLSGYQRNALGGSKKAFAAAIYQFDLGRSFLNLEQYPLYFGVSTEAGNVWQQEQEITHQDLILSSSAYIGTETSLGPVALGYGRTDSHSDAFYFYMGKNF